MIRLVSTISDRLLSRLVPAEAASACIVRTYKAPCRLRTGRCEMPCTEYCDGTVTCSPDDCVC